MTTFNVLEIYACEGEGSEPVDGSAPTVSDPSRPFHGSGTPYSGVEATSPHSVMQNYQGLPLQQRPDDPSWETTLLGTDQRRTVLHKRAAQDQADLVYTPYGHSQDTGGMTSGLGFNGERRESVTGHYLLGAGYRAFNPVLMRFNSPDSLSPFRAGGLNPYAYCLGDPVNFVDPTGHLPSWAMVAIGIGGSIALTFVSGGVGTLVAGTMAASTAAAVGSASMILGVGLEIGAVGTGVAAQVMGGEEGNLLGKISMGLGLAAGVVGGVGGGMKVGAGPVDLERKVVKAFESNRFLKVQPGTPAWDLKYDISYEEFGGVRSLSRSGNSESSSLSRSGRGSVFSERHLKEYVGSTLKSDPSKPPPGFASSLEVKIDSAEKNGELRRTVLLKSLRSGHRE